MRLLIVLLCTLITHVQAADKISREMEISELDDGVYLHTSFKFVEEWGLVGSNGLVVMLDQDAYIIDTPWSADDTETLVNWIADQGFDLKGSLSTHWHDDRTEGVAFLNARSIPTYASELTNELLAQNDKVLASQVFEETEYWWVPGQIGAFYFGGGHTIDNLVVWLPGSNILVGGCLIRSLGSKNLGYTGEALIEAWSDTVEEVQSRFPGAKIVVPGHGAVGDPGLLAHTRMLAARAAGNILPLNDETSTR